MPLFLRNWRETLIEACGNPSAMLMSSAVARNVRVPTDVEPYLHEEGEVKKVDLDQLQVIEQSGEVAWGLLCGGGCTGFACFGGEGNLCW